MSEAVIPGYAESNGASVAVENLNEEQQRTKQRIETEFKSEMIRLESLPIFQSLRNTFETLDSRPCQTCRIEPKGRKEVLWWDYQQILRLLPVSSLRGEVVPRPAKSEQKRVDLR